MLARAYSHIWLCLFVAFSLHMCINCVCVWCKSRMVLLSFSTKLTFKKQKNRCKMESFDMCQCCFFNLFTWYSTHATGSKKIHDIRNPTNERTHLSVNELKICCIHTYRWIDLIEAMLKFTHTNTQTPYVPAPHNDIMPFN